MHTYTFMERDPYNSNPNEDREWNLAQALHQKAKKIVQPSPFVFPISRLHLPSTLPVVCLSL